MNKNSWLDRPVIQGTGLTWETTLYLLIIILCLVSRLAMLGERVISHDESLHTQYSWYLYSGRGFHHNPMMHGPLVFHVTALTYWLFGDNNFTARMPVALMGTLLVAFPYLLRRYLGRYGALLASLLLLISPSINYYSRYIRMDVPAMLWAMVSLWGIFRYLEEGQARYLYVLAAGLSLMYATKEVAPIYTMIVAAFLLLLFVVQVLSGRWPRPAARQALIAALAAAGLGLVVLVAGAVGREEGVSLPPWALLGGVLTLLAMLVAAAALLYGLGRELRSYRSFDLIVLVGTLCLPFASPLLMLIASRLGQAVVARAADPALVPAFWSNLAALNLLNYQPPDIYYTLPLLALAVLAACAIGLAWDWRRWSVAAAIHTALFMVFFTTVFTNVTGIASGWIGSVGYWLPQQEVERGTQPLYYYLVILPLYDFFPLLGALGGALLMAVRGVLDKRDQGFNLLLLFLPLWTLLAWIGYSYAGERMPWISVHIALPMILLSGWLLGQIVEALDWPAVWRHYGWTLLLLLPALAAALAALWRSGQQMPFRGLELAQLQVTGNFLAALAGLGLLVALVGWLIRRLGLHNGLLLAALTVSLVLALLTVHVACRFSFVNYDRPAEFLVYAHNGPDVRTTMQQLEELSLRIAGGPQQIDVAYNLDVNSFLFYWYLRDYPNARFYGEQPTREDVQATAVIAAQEQWLIVEPYLGNDYYTFNYTHYWWPMEDYRDLTWARIREWLDDPLRRRALWRIFYDMDYTLYDQITGETHRVDDWPLQQRFRLYVRKDVAELVWGQAGVLPEPEGEMEPEAPSVPLDPYAAGWQSLAADLAWGTAGSEPGQFSWPRDVAVSADGRVYVTDSQNHRIQEFTADGEFVRAWGSHGNCGEAEVEPGTFCEPWGLAVGPDSSVYVADTWAHRVQRFTADGELLDVWGHYGEYAVDNPDGQSAFYGPRDVAVGPDGAVHVVDTGNKRVQVFTAAGEFLWQWGGSGAALGQMEEPLGLAVGPDGSLYVADTWNRRVQVVQPDGTPLLSWPISGWNNPNSDERPYVAVDDAGQAYVSDPGHYRVLVFDRNGEYLYSFGQFGFDNSSFSAPMGLAIGPDDSLYVVDAAGQRVMRFATRGQGD